MVQFKRKIILISSIIIPILPIIAVVSCHHETESINKKSLNKEAKTLKVSNFHYDGQAFDTSKIASTYKVATKISGLALSKDTELIAVVVVANETSLIITYTLKNGETSSNIQEFIYYGFRAEAPIVKTITKETLNKEARALKASNFIYDGKAFDTSKVASTYNDYTKISGSVLSKDTTLTATKIEVDGDKLKITYELQNGSISSDQQIFTYLNFKLDDQTIVDNYIKLIEDITTTTTKELDQFASVVTYTSIMDFNSKTNVVLELPPKNVKVNIVSTNIDDTNGQQTITFTITKGSKHAVHTIIVTKFKLKSLATSDTVKAAMAYLKKRNNEIGPTNVDGRAGVDIFFLEHSNFKIQLYKDATNQVTDADLTSTTILDWYKTFTKATEKAKGIRAEIQFSNENLKTIAKTEGQITKLVIRPSDTEGIIPSERYTIDSKKIAKWGKTLNDIRPDQWNSQKLILQVWAILENGEEVPFGIRAKFEGEQFGPLFKKTTNQKLVDLGVPTLTYNDPINDETKINVGGKEVHLLQYILADETIKNGKTFITKAIFAEIKKKLNIDWSFEKNNDRGGVPLSKDEKSKTLKFPKVSDLVLKDAGEEGASIEVTISIGTNHIDLFTKILKIKFSSLLTPTLYAERTLTSIFKEYKDEPTPLVEFVDGKQGVHLWSISSKAFIFTFEPKVTNGQTVKSWYKKTTRRENLVVILHNDERTIFNDAREDRVGHLKAELDAKGFDKFVIRKYGHPDIEKDKDKTPKTWGKNLVDAFPAEKDSTKATLQVWALFKDPKFKDPDSKKRIWIPFVIRNIPSPTPFKKTLNQISVEKAALATTKIGKLKTNLIIVSDDVKALVNLIKTTNFNKAEKVTFEIALTKILVPPTEDTKYTVLDPKLITYDASTRKLSGKIYVTKGKKLHNFFIKEITLDITIPSKNNFA